MKLAPREVEKLALHGAGFLAQKRLARGLQLNYTEAIALIATQVGKMADLVLWKPSFFGAKPEMVIKGGAIAWANVGDPNASIPTPEPVIMRPMFSAFSKAGSSNAFAFISKAAEAAKIREEYGLKKRVRAVHNVRGLTKLDMKLNDALPKIEVDPETYTVTADGEVLACEPVTTVPLSRNYFLF